MNKIVLTAVLSLNILAFSASAGDMATNLDQFFSKSGTVATEENYPTLETSRQLLKTQDQVGVNQLLHKRELTPTDQQPVVRMNRDTYYTFAVVDTSKGAYITMPEVPEGTYMSVQPVTEDHRIQAMVYGSGNFNLSTHDGNYLHLVIRLDSTLPKAEAHKYQDLMKITAKSSIPFTSKPVNKESFHKVEADLKAQMPALFKAEGAEALYGMFTDPRDSSKEMFTEKKYAIGAAIGWGGAQLKDNVYEVSGNYAADKCYQATFEDPKNRAFWSFTVYDKNGFMFNDLASLSSNSATANKDGTYTMSFGCGDDAINNIKTKNETGMFNLGIRHYMPSDKVINGYRLLPLLKAK
ncbi:DUF1254 domain-containing protein [Thalassotalea psychrophila]|uniref:DUF1254 domain-containing protein n=1 Tax=Thalassotalea psychrophila TaxID=3065647 RepID=A0ABY9U3Q5_9GAMM|nr:DUF1254 domain-containing protein [Colwelliaceae bacterium SQ149]